MTHHDQYASPELNAANARRAEHDAIWQPILAAHRVASALRQIAADLPLLSAEAKQAFLPYWDAATVPVDAVQSLQQRKADALELAAPLPVTLTEEDREALFDSIYDMECDSTPKDRTWVALDRMTEADKAEFIAQAELEEGL